MTELEALAVLTCMPILTNSKIHLLLNSFGSALKVLNSNDKEIVKFFPKNERFPELWKSYKSFDLYAKNFDLMEKFNVNLIAFTDILYPKQLKKIANPPALLYVMGSIKDWDSAFAVVGTRDASEYGLKTAFKFGQEMAQKKLSVVSGLAKGIDTAAHQGALMQGKTIAVLGSGIAAPYPKENEGLIKQIVLQDRGCVVSEFPMLTPPAPKNFLLRNRIITGLSQGVLLIESPGKGGAMHAMDEAFKQKKPLFTIPGQIDCGNFSGNHLLIKKRKAQLVENFEDIENYYSALFH